MFSSRLSLALHVDGDANVQTNDGKSFVILYSLIGMWLFGWAADSLTSVVEAILASAARGLYKLLHFLYGKICCRATSSSVASHSSAAIESMDTLVAIFDDANSPVRNYREEPCSPVQSYYYREEQPSAQEGNASNLEPISYR
jgi:hypothetical protein